MEKFTKHYENLIGIIVAILMIAFFLFVASDVFCRNVIKVSVVWFNEASTFTFMWMAFIGGVAAFLRNEHYKMEIFSQRIEEKFAWAFHYVEMASVFVFAFVMFYFGLQLCAINASTYSIALHLQMSKVISVFPVSGIGILVSLVCMEWKFRKDRREKQTLQQNDGRR